MKRDMDLVRLILLALEGDEKASAESKSKYDDRTIVYHAALLVEAGFIEGTIRTDQDQLPADCSLRRMTWAGHDFLDAMRDDTIWMKAKDTILKPIGGVAFDVLKEWLKLEMKKQLGMPLV